MRWALSALVLAVVLGSCGGAQQPKAYVSELTSDDSVNIKIGEWKLIKFHSDKLGFDIDYPSFLVHQDLSEEPGQELFMSDDMSISVMVDSLQGMTRSPGQQLISMGADLVDVGDNYSILEGADEEWDYYGKVIDVDTLRMVTLMLRYNPTHSEAVEPLREWIRNFKIPDPNEIGEASEARNTNFL